MIDIVNLGITVKESLGGLTLEEKLSKMEKLRQDLYSLSIIWESGTGKTAIINSFCSQFDRIDKGEYDCFSVVYTVTREANVFDRLSESHKEFRELVATQINSFRLKFFQTLTLPLNERIPNQKQIILEAIIEMAKQGIKVGIRPLSNFLVT